MNRASIINEKLAYEIGGILAKIHAIKTQGHGDLTQPDQLSVDPRIPFMLKFEEGIDERKDHLPGSLIDQCRITFDRKINLLSEADGPCIVHCDFRPVNVMVFNNQKKGQKLLTQFQLLSSFKTIWIVSILKTTHSLIKHYHLFQSL